MPPFYDQEVRYEQGSDSGENDSASIQPLVAGENIWHTNFNRVAENLRKRTEVLRRELEDLKYVADADRALIIQSPGTFLVSVTGSGRMKLVPSPAGEVWVYPALSPGQLSGGRARGARLFVNGQAYAGTLNVNDLAIVASAATTGQRGYADGASLDEAATLTIGANDISVEIVADSARNGGAATIQAEVTGNPERRIKITYGTLSGGTTIGQLVTFINTDSTSQGTYGLRHLIFASASSSALASTAIPTFGPTRLQGGIDAEAHRVTVAQLTAFFAEEENHLADGEALAIAFPDGPVEPAPGTGGRRQSLFDLPVNRIGGSTSNVTPAVGHNLINTGREPEKVPGAIPIGKRIGSEFIFVDGTRVPTGLSAGVALGESATTLARLSASTGTTGASMVGYGGSPAWHADSADSLTSSTVEAAVDEVVSDLAGTATGSSGARRVGSELVVASPSIGNRGLNVTAGSLREQISTIVGGAPGASSDGGLLYRVSERGHKLHGKRPLEKDYRETTPEDLSGGGAMLTRAILNAPPGGVYAGAQKEEAHAVTLQPVHFTGASDDHLSAEEPYDVATADYVHLSAMSTARAEVIRSALGLHSSLELHCVVEVLGIDDPADGSDGNGLYYAQNLDKDNQRLTLRRLDGSTPNFVVNGYDDPKVKFYNAHIVGNSANGARVRMMTATNSAAMMTFGPDGRAILRAYGSSGALYHENTPGRARWQIGQPTVRDTENILSASAKAELDGHEGALSMHAYGHHHGGAYTRTRFWDERHVYGLTDHSFIVLLSGYVAGTPDTVTAAATIHAGYVKVAVILDVELHLKAEAAAAAGASVNAVIELRKKGTSVVVRKLQKEFRKVVAGSATEEVTFTEQVILPIDENSQFDIVLVSTFNVDEADSHLRLYEVGGVLKRIDAAPATNLED